jgi:hypothetical protein
MPHRRATVVLAIPAALAWAPSSVFSAAPAAGRDDDGLGLILLAGAALVGLVALVGSAWVILAGRRDRRAGAAPVDPAPTDPTLIAAAIVEQRALRRARLRSSDDPILAAMGLPDEDAATGAAPPPRARSTRPGRGRPPTP